MPWPRSLAVVIVNFNGERLLADCLQALREQTVAPAEIVVADNGSSDGSVALLARDHPEARVVELGRNHGFAGGANRGVRATSAPLVCVLNSDAAPAPDWIERLLAAPAGDDVWALGSVLVSATTGRIESAGDQYAPEGYAYKLLRDQPLSALPADPYPVFAPPGAAPVFRRAVFDALGGYEESFFLYYEDVDLSFRAGLAGHRALMVPDARVVHRLGASGSRPRVRFHVARNSVWCAVRCMPEPDRRAVLRRWLNELRFNRPRRLVPWEVAGRAAAVIGLPRVLRERRAIQAARVIGPERAQELLQPPPVLSAPRQAAGAEASTPPPRPRR